MNGQMDMVVNSYQPSDFKLIFAPFWYQNYISFTIYFISISFDDIPLTFEWKIKIKSNPSFSCCSIYSNHNILQYAYRTNILYLFRLILQYTNKPVYRYSSNVYVYFTRPRLNIDVYAYFTRRRLNRRAPAI